MHWQVDYLQQANRDLEKKLRNAVDKRDMESERSADLEAKNAELMMELKNIGRASKRLEEEKSMDVNLLRNEMMDARVWFFPFVAMF